MTFRTALRSCIYAAAGVLVLAGDSAGQQLIVPGRLLGPDGAPIAQERVLLHRVDASGGATVAEDTSAADGAFALVAPASADSAAVFFVAAHFEGELYIGEPFRPSAGAAEAPPQLLQVGVPGTSASALVQGGQVRTGPVPTGQPATTRSWLLLIVPLVGVAGVAVYALFARGRIPHSRTLLIRIAEIDERLDSAPVAQQDELRAERARLISRLQSG